MAGTFEQKKTRKTGCVIVLFALICIAVVLAFGLKRSPAERMEFRIGENVLVRVEEEETLGELKALLAGAEDIGYVPKTFFLGPELVFTGEDGNSTALELDLYGDLYRYAERFFDYGPGNDNNALPELLALLGWEDWPEEVKAAWPECFVSPEEDVPTLGEYRQQAVYMDLWYPDWSWLKIREEDALVIEAALKEEEPVPADREKVPVEESVYTIHIAYDDGREYDLARIGEGEFLLWKSGTDTVYSILSPELGKTVEDMIARSRE